MENLKDILQDMLGHGSLAVDVHIRISEWIAKGNVQYKGKTFQQLEEELNECIDGYNIANRLLEHGSKPLIAENRSLYNELKRIKFSSECDEECKAYKK